MSRQSAQNERDHTLTQRKKYRYGVIFFFQGGGGGVVVWGGGEGGNHKGFPKTSEETCYSTIMLLLVSIVLMN